MALYDRRFSRGLLAAKRLAAMMSNDHMEGVIQSGDAIHSDSELSTVSSRRYSGLEDDWWKEKALEAPEALEALEAPEGSKGLEGSKATVTAMRTPSKDKRVHWE
jgi:hypothetical protein